MTSRAAGGRVVAALALLGTLVAPSIQAGTNAGGRAWLSWDRAGLRTDRPAAPGTTFPLYLQLSNAPDVAGLAVTFVWNPFMPDSACYSVISTTSAFMSSTNPDSLSGGASTVRPRIGFAGDTTYAWTISFPAGTTSRHRVAYLVSAATCVDPPPATFALSSVFTLDSEGSIDTLTITGGATIFGPMFGVPVVSRTQPQNFLPGAAPTLRVYGRNFLPGSRVRLRHGDDIIEASAVQVVGPTEFLAAFRTPLTARSYDLLVQLPDGRTGSLADAITATQSTSTAPSCPSVTPSDDQHAFAPIDLHANISATVGDIFQHVSHPQYPDLQSAALLVVSGFDNTADTVALIQSSPLDHLGLELHDPTSQTYVIYALNPPQYATSFSLLAMGSLIFSSGNSNDAGKELLQVTALFEDGDFLVTDMNVGTYLRDWQTGSNCNSSPYFVDVPSDPSTVVVYSDTPPGLSGPIFYDLHRIAIPSGQWTKKLSQIRLSAKLIDHTCEGIGRLDGTSALFGLTADAKMLVTDAGGNPPPLQKQSGTCGSDPYGGYLRNGSLLGSRLTMQKEGCFVSAASMVHNFYGIPCTPRALNQWLQAHNGYAARPYATITDVLGQGPGDVLRYKNVSAVDTLIAGNQFLIERAVHEPLVTAQVSAVPTRSADGRATILQRYLPDPIVSGALGKVYSLAVNAAVGDRFSGGTWTLRQNGRQVDSCERAMAGGSPVLLYVRRRGACGHHWVVGDGRDAAFVADNVARGTYEILDPGYDFHRLLDGSNTNHFWDCRSCVRKSFGNPNTARSTGAGTDASMMLVLNGPAFLTVADSLGEEIDYDSQSDSYVSGVPDAIALRGWVDDDDVDGTETSGAIDVIELPVAASSSLTVRLTGQATGSFGLVAQAYSGSVAGSDAVTGECSGGASSTFLVTYSPGSPNTVSIAPAPAAVGDISDEGRLLLVVAPNPSAGRASVSCALPAPTTATVEVFDVQGRRVAVLFSGILPRGRQVLEWDAEAAERGPAHSGLYFVRLSAKGVKAQTRRLLLVR